MLDFSIYIQCVRIDLSVFFLKQQKYRGNQEVRNKSTFT